MHTNDIRNLLNTLKTLEVESKQAEDEIDIVNEDLASIINKMKNKVSNFVGKKVADEQGAETPAEEETIEQKIERQINARLDKIYTAYVHDFTSASVRPTVKNTIKWLQQHPSISDNTILAHAFKGIGIDVTSILKEPDDIFADLGKHEEPAKPEEKSEPPKAEEPKDEPKAEPTDDQKAVKIGDLKDGTHFSHSWAQQDGTERTSTGVRTGTNEHGQVTVKWDSGSNGSLQPSDTVTVVDAPKVDEPIPDEVKNADEPKKVSSGEKNKERVKRLFDLLGAASVHFNDDNRFKSILGTTIASDPTADDHTVVKNAIEKFGKGNIKRGEEPAVQEEPVPIQPEKQQKQEDKKEGKVLDNTLVIRDKNDRQFLPGQVVKAKIRRGTSKFEAFGKVKALLRGVDKEKDMIVRVLFMGEDIGSAEDMIMDIGGWELLKDKDRLIVWDSDEDDLKAAAESYEKKFTKLLMETKYHFGNILNEAIMPLVEAMVNIALSEDEEVENDELTKAEILGLFEILLYMSIAKKKGFNVTDVTPKFKNDEHVKAYLKRMYTRMLNTMKQYKDVSSQELQDAFKEVYQKVMAKLSQELHGKVQHIAAKMIKEKNNYPMGIAFFTVLFTIMTEQRNSKVLSQYIDRLYQLVADIKAKPTAKPDASKANVDHLGRKEPTL